MIKKLCIIGNSHLGALAQSDSKMKAFAKAGFDVVFWGVPGKLFPQIACDEGMLLSPSPERSRIISSGRYGDLPLDDFDCILFYGFKVELSKVAARITNQLATLNKHSKAFQKEVITELIATWWEKEFGRALMQTVIDEKPEIRYLFTPNPLIASNEIYFSKITDLALLPTVVDALYSHCNDWCAVRGITFYRQPSKTLASNKTTSEPSFSKNSIKMEAKQPHPDDDYSHMNESYGDAIMGDLVKLLIAE